MMVWAEWFETADRRVALDKLPLATVSTVFVGLDHNFFDEGPPLLFETRVFAVRGLEGPMAGGFQSRCSTWEQAVRMHAEVMAALLSAHQEAAG